MAEIDNLLTKIETKINKLYKLYKLIDSNEITNIIPKLIDSNKKNNIIQQFINGKKQLNNSKKKLNNRILQLNFLRKNLSNITSQLTTNRLNINKKQLINLNNIKQRLINFKKKLNNNQQQIIENQEYLAISNTKLNIIKKELNNIEQQLISTKVSLNTFNNIIFTINNNYWFESSFKFKESKFFLKNKYKFDNLLRNGNNTKINNYNIGSFNIYMYSDIISVIFDTVSLNPIITVENIFLTIEEIHQNESNQNATVQIETQFNCLMNNIDNTPEDGISIYINEQTNSQIAAMQTPGGIAHRNYYLNIPTQINMADELLDFFKKINPKFNYEYKNGYLLLDNTNIKIINDILIIKKNYDKAESLIKIASHRNMSVYTKNYNINHVLCSNIKFQNYIYQYNICNFEILYNLFLKSSYINTLLVACHNNMLNRVNKPCYLTLMDGLNSEINPEIIHPLIINAITEACNFINESGYSLHIKIINIKNIYDKYKYNSIERLYPLK